MAEHSYSVRMQQEPSGWTVQILDGSQAAVFTRACRDEAEARTFASTVRQHLYWLSPDRFREYYRLNGEA